MMRQYVLIFVSPVALVSRWNTGVLCICPALVEVRLRTLSGFEQRRDRNWVATGIDIGLPALGHTQIRTLPNPHLIEECL